MEYGSLCSGGITLQRHVAIMFCLANALDTTNVPAQLSLESQHSILEKPV